MLSKLTWSSYGIVRDTLLKRWPRTFDKDEKESLDYLYMMLFGKKFAQAWYDWSMESYRCCAEMVVSREAIQRNPKAVYQVLLDLIENNPIKPWGKIMERTWENLFKFGKSTEIMMMEKFGERGFVSL